MSNLHLVTGYAGAAHVTSADHGAFNAAMHGAGDYVLDSGMKFSAQVVSNNLVRIFDGDMLIHGRHVNLKKDTYVDVSIANGLQGLNRNDLIVVRYTKDATTGVENTDLVVIQGVSTDGTASDPEYTTGDILDENCLLHDMPLYRIPLAGLNVGEPVQLFELYEKPGETIQKVQEAMAKSVKNVNDSLESHKTNKQNPHGVTASQVGLGNVPNVTTNDQTPTYNMASDVANLASGEKLSVAFGKIAKAIAGFISHIATSASTTVSGHVKFGTASGTACQGNDTRLSDSRTPKAHASTATTYGIGNGSNYGHVKLSDTYTSKVASGAAANGMAASQNALYNAYSALHAAIPAMTMRYNQETDTVQIFNGTEWVDWKSGEQSQIDVYKSFANASDWTISLGNSTCKSAVSVSNGAFVITSTGHTSGNNNSYYHSHWTNDVIDLSKFSKLEINASFGRGIKIGLCKDVGTTTPDVLLVDSDTTSSYVKTIDLSGYTDDYHLFIATNTYQTNTTFEWIFNTFRFTN